MAKQIHLPTLEMLHLRALPWTVTRQLTSAAQGVFPQCVSRAIETLRLPFSHALVSQHGSIQEENSGGSTRKHRGGKQRTSRYECIRRGQGGL